MINIKYLHKSGIYKITNIVNNKIYTDRMIKLKDITKTSLSYLYVCLKEKRLINNKYYITE